MVRSDATIPKLPCRPEYTCSAARPVFVPGWCPDCLIGVGTGSVGRPLAAGRSNCGRRVSCTSGCLAGAPGLQVTSTGAPKVIDVVDGSGDGDVDTSKTVQADEEGWITGCTGKSMKVNPDWKNPTGEPRVAMGSGTEIRMVQLQSCFRTWFWR